MTLVGRFPLTLRGALTQTNPLLRTRSKLLARLDAYIEGRTLSVLRILEFASEHRQDCYRMLQIDRHRVTDVRLTI
jgi:hypothetical protein